MGKTEIPLGIHTKQTLSVTNEVILPLSPKEQKIMFFLQECLEQNGWAPTYMEIKNQFGFASIHSVQRYLKQLHEKGYIHMPGGNKKRAISLMRTADAAKTALKEQLNHTRKQPFELQLLGKVAAGHPIEDLNYDEKVEVPRSMVLHPEKSFALKVKGQSMVGDGIFDGDLLIVQAQSTARNGEIAVAVVDNEATVKRFYLHSGGRIATPQVELRPANPDLESMWYAPDQVEIRGIVVGLLRKF